MTQRISWQPAVFFLLPPAYSSRALSTSSGRSRGALSRRIIGIGTQMVLKWERASTSSAALSAETRSNPSSAPSRIYSGGHNRPTLGRAMRHGCFAKSGSWSDGRISNFSSLPRGSQAMSASASCSSVSLTWRLFGCPCQTRLYICSIVPLHRRRVDSRAALPEDGLRSSSPRLLSSTLHPRMPRTACVRHLALHIALCVAAFNVLPTSGPA